MLAHRQMLPSRLLLLLLLSQQVALLARALAAAAAGMAQTLRLAGLQQQAVSPAWPALLVLCQAGLGQQRGQTLQLLTPCSKSAYTHVSGFTTIQATTSHIKAQQAPMTRRSVHLNGLKRA
jgi:hypothetical protein